MKQDVQFIEKGGQPEWAIIPYKDYQKLMKIYQCFDDKFLLRQALERNEKNEALPHEIVTKLVNGDNPIRVLRKYRYKTITETAKGVGVTQSYLSQLETSKKHASQKVLKALAQYLQVDIEDFI